MEERHNITVSQPLGWSLILTIFFSVLRFFNVIDWDWFWILSPLWITIAAICLFILAFMIYILISDNRNYDIKETYVEGKLVSRKVNGKETINKTVEPR